MIGDTVNAWILNTFPTITKWVGGLGEIGLLLFAMGFLFLMVLAVMACYQVKYWLSYTEEEFDPSWMDAEAWEECRREERRI